MKKAVRTICYDEELKIEAYWFQGIEQSFPNHFHEHYMMGYIDGGKHQLTCKDRDYTVEKGDLALLHPGEIHACAHVPGWTLDYLGFNITRETMGKYYQEITGQEGLPGFTRTVIRDEEVNRYLRPLHQMMMDGSKEFEKEELLLLFLEMLFQKYAQPFDSKVISCGKEIDKACEYMETHYTERISLDQICRYAGLSKSTLLRSFTREKGITPYRYLEMVRINHAKKLLEQGVTPVEAALRTGFSDQSHFTNYFSRFIGIAPGAYRDIFEGTAVRSQEETKERGKQETGEAVYEK